MVRKIKKTKIDRCVTTTIGTRRLRIWSSKSGADADKISLQMRGYKVSMTPDKKTVIIHGKMSRGYERNLFGKRVHRSRTLRQRRSTAGVSPTLRQRRVGSVWLQ